MNTCGLTRLLVPGFLVGLAAATMLGNDLAGWIAAATTIAILAVIQKVRGTGGTCAIAPGAVEDDRTASLERDVDRPVR